MGKYKLLYKIEIVDYIERILFSKKRRPQYYIKGITIPRKYKNEDYCFKDNVLIEKKTGTKIIKNTKTVGKEKYVKISGQDIWVGKNYYRRSKIGKEMKKYFYEYFKNLKPIPRVLYPIGVDIDVYDIMDGSDIDNMMMIYRKSIHDAMAGNIEFIEKDGKQVRDESYNKLIIDDGRNYIRKISSEFFPISTDEKKKLVIKIYSLMTEFEYSEEFKEELKLVYPDNFYLHTLAENNSTELLEALNSLSDDKVGNSEIIDEIEKGAEGVHNIYIHAKRVHEKLNIYNMALQEFEDYEFKKEQELLTKEENKDDK